MFVAEFISTEEVLAEVKETLGLSVSIRGWGCVRNVFEVSSNDSKDVMRFIGESAKRPGTLLMHAEWRRG